MKRLKHALNIISVAEWVQPCNLQTRLGDNGRLKIIFTGLQMLFQEDNATNRVGHSAQNLTLVRRLVMNMVNLFDPSVGLAAARRFATHESEYLKGMLIKVFGKAVKSF